MNKKKIFSGVKIVLAISLLIVLFMQLNKEAQQTEELREKEAKKDVRLDIAIVNEDDGVKFGDKEYKLAANYIKKIEKDNSHDWYVVSRGIAESGLKTDKYQLMITIPSSFSGKLLDIDKTAPEKININYKVNSNGNAEIENESNKVGTKIINDLDKQLVDMYLASILDNLYSAQVNIGKVAKNQHDYVNNYKDNVFQPAVNFQNYLPGLTSQSESASQSNEFLTKTLEGYTDGFEGFIEAQKSYDTQLEELLAKRAEDKLTYEEFLAALNDMDTSILSDETEAIYKELKRLDIFYQTNLGNDLTQDAFLTQYYDIKDNFMAEPQGEDALVVDLSLTKQIERGRKNLNLNEIRGRFYQEMMRYFFGNNEIANDELTLKDILNGDEKHVFKSKKASDEITAIVESYKTFRATNLTQQKADRTKNLAILEEAYNSLPIHELTELPNSGLLTQDEQDELSGYINVIDTKIGDHKAIVDTSDKQYFEDPSNGTALLPIANAFGNYSTLESDFVSNNYKYSGRYAIPIHQNVEVLIHYDDTLINISKAEIFGFTNDSGPIVNPNEITINADTPDGNSGQLEIEYTYQRLPELSNANNAVEFRMKIEGQGFDTSTPPVLVPELTYHIETPIDYSNYRYDDYINKVRDFEVEKAKLLELLATTKKLFEDIEIKHISDDVDEELFNEDFFGLSVKTMMEDMINVAFQPEFDRQVEVFNHLETKAGIITQQFGPLNLRLDDINKNTMALQENVSSQLDNIDSLRSLLAGIQAGESKVAGTNESTDSSIASSKERMTGLLESSQGIKESSENNVKESETVKDVLGEFKKEVDTAEGTSKELANNADTVLAKFEEELRNNGEFYDSFNKVMSNSQKEGVQNETLLQFLANPVNGTNELTVNTTETYKPFTWILMLFTVSLFTAYAFATQDLGKKVRKVFDQDHLWVSDNILNTVLVTLTGGILGGIFSVISQRALEIPQEEKLLWSLVIIFIMTIFVLLNHFLIKQFNLFGIGVSLFFLTSYVFLTSAIGKTNAVNSFGNILKGINPLSRSESILISFLSNNILSGVTLLTLLFVVFIGIVANILIWHSRKAKNEVALHD